MSKNIPRKIKKACKNITLVYGNDEAWSLIDNIPKYRRNTKWNRKAISFIKREEKLKLKHMEREVHNLFMEKFKEFEQSK